MPEQRRCTASLQSKGLVHVSHAIPLYSGEGYDLVTVHCHLAEAEMVLGSKDTPGS